MGLRVGQFHTLSSLAFACENGAGVWERVMKTNVRNKSKNRIQSLERKIHTILVNRHSCAVEIKEVKSLSGRLEDYLRVRFALQHEPHLVRGGLFEAQRDGRHLDVWPVPASLESALVENYQITLV